MVIIEKLKSENWRMYKNMRLFSLEQAPDAYGSTWASASQISDEEWMARANRFAQADACVNFMAFTGRDPVGMASCYISDKAELVQMWVDPRARGQKVGEQLVISIRDWLTSKNIQELHAGVYESNLSAQKLYLRIGFIELSRM